MPKRLITILGGITVLLFILGALLGSSGTTDGETGTAQQVSNIVMPISVLLGVATLVVIALSAARLSRKDR
jgi:hypothetical protein